MREIENIIPRNNSIKIPSGKIENKNSLPLEHENRDSYPEMEMKEATSIVNINSNTDLNEEVKNNNSSNILHTS
jgi:hypothetical protein